MLAVVLVMATAQTAAAATKPAQMEPMPIVAASTTSHTLKGSVVSKATNYGRLPVVFAEHTIDDTKTLAARTIHREFNSYNGGAPVGERRNGPRQAHHSGLSRFTVKAAT